MVTEYEQIAATANGIKSTAKKDAKRNPRHRQWVDNRIFMVLRDTLTLHVILPNIFSIPVQSALFNNVEMEQLQFAISLLLQPSVCERNGNANKIWNHRKCNLLVWNSNFFPNLFESKKMMRNNLFVNPWSLWKRIH